MTPRMKEALRNLADGEMKHGAHVLPGLNGHRRNGSLNALAARGLISRYRTPFKSGRNGWVITERGQMELRLRP